MCKCMCDYVNIISSIYFNVCTYILCKELTQCKRLWCWEGLRAWGVGDERGWDGWMASPTRWMWVWVNCGSWWWTGRPGVLWFMGSQRVGHDWETELTLIQWMQCLSVHSVVQLCLNLCNLMNCSLPGSYIHEIFQARILEWVNISFSRGSYWLGSNLCLLNLLHWQVLFQWATWEASCT